MRVILQRDIIIAGQHRKKGDTADIGKDQFHYLKNTGAIVAHRDEAVRESVPPQLPVKVEKTMTGKNAVEGDAPEGEEPESLLTPGKSKK